MFTPRILVKHPFQIANLRVEVCAHEWQAPTAYDALVDVEWERMLRNALTRMWDGTYYRVLDVDELGNGADTILLGTVRYRYIATYSALNEHRTSLKLEPLNHLSTVVLIRTRDDFYVFGIRARNGATELIGGGVQSDELTVSSGADIELNLFKEMREEIGIERGHFEDMRGIGVVYSSTSNVLIVGHIQAKLSKTEVREKFRQRTEDEMAEPVFIPANKLREVLRGMPNDRGLIPELL